MALGETGAELAVPSLATVLTSDNSLCLSAGRALGEIGTPTAISVLMETLQQGDWKQRRCALQAFSYIPDSESSVALMQARRQAVPLLIEALQHNTLEDGEKL